MVDAWTFAGEPSSGGNDPSTTTLLDGTTFCISNAVGDLEPDASHGLFVADTRFLCTWRLRVDGTATTPMSVIAPDAAGATFVTRVRSSPLRPDSAVVVTRERYVGEGMSEMLGLRNLSRSPVSLHLRLDAAADFAHLFEVKEDRVQPRGFHSVEVVDQQMIFAFRDGGRARRLSIRVPEDATAGPGRIEFTVDLAGLGEWYRSFDFLLRVDEVDLASRHSAGRHGPSAAAAGFQEWRRTTSRIEVAHDDLNLALTRSVADLGALRIEDQELDDDAVIAAGAPWYMAMFGRDSLITSQMSLLLDPGMGLGTLRALARHQGEKVDVETEEQPGRILHEMRFRIDGGREGPSRSAYYGSIDSTPLFVCLLGELARFGLAEHEVRSLLPAADRALEWVDDYGDRDGDGFVEYERLSPRGLVNQGWKDSVDGINFRSGERATGPIALCEVQGYVYAAWRARAYLARMFDDGATARRCDDRASALRDAFEAAFWMEDQGCYAVALDGDKRRVDSITSNVGHLLWTGIAGADRAGQLAERLVSPELESGWGVRTLSSEMGAYNPMSYHNGSVWPHDTAIAIAGLARYGFASYAEGIAGSLVAASHAFNGRLPELFCGFGRGDFSAPVADPIACAPQAWASAAPISVLRSLLGFEPDIPNGVVKIAAEPSALLGSVHVSGLPLGDARVALAVEDGAVTLTGLPDGVAVVSDHGPFAAR